MLHKSPASEIKVENKVRTDRANSTRNLPTNLNRLADASGSYTRLQQHLQRIRGLAKSDGVIYSGNDVLEQVTAVFSVLLRIESALHELQRALESLVQLDASTTLSLFVRDNVQDLLTMCDDVKSRFKGLMENVQLSSFHFLLTGQ